ncbi:MAG: hypothetical protein IT377_31230 [Polyangiaceae bacterium]|nr:hypothetical protein [Polyangiaceae bacterium]
MRWFSRTGEYAFLSVGGTARGVIAIGGVAHGVVAVGGVASVGVVSIGLNAMGSVVALGMNAVAPISLSLINALGFYVVAGINGWGAWTRAATNATGIAAQGGVNSTVSVLPAAVFTLLALVLSTVFRGRRSRGGPISLGRFQRANGVARARVRARLGRVEDDRIELTGDGDPVWCRVDAAMRDRAADLLAGAVAGPPHVAAEVVRGEERVAGEAPDGASYRERIPEVARELLTCVSLEPAAEEAPFWPKDADEMQWVVAWTARLALVAAGMLLGLSAR